uniref:Immunoglobulin V-set domain-containing protein n=1 Tax=Stegastes partitus TaxID=144197 RepID=A0A3B5A8N0_9TELE
MCCSKVRLVWKISPRLWVCPEPFTHTAYTTAKTTIACGHGALKSNLFCKDNGFFCEDILSTESSRKSNGRFTLTNTAGGFTVSIRDVSLQDAGVYWCGKKSTHRTSTSRVLHTKVHLDVKSESFTSSASERKGWRRDGDDRLYYQEGGCR